MPRKKQPSHKDKAAGKFKADLGQKEAELEKTRKEQMSHMAGGKANKTAQRQPTKRRPK